MGEQLIANANNASAWTGTLSMSTSQLQITIDAGQWKTNTVITSLRYMPASGTITGTFALYGLKK